MEAAYRAAGQPDSVPAAYIAAAAAHPSDPDILLGLFGVYIKQRDFVRAQQTCMKMKKVQNAEKDCGWWMVVCVALQALSAFDTDAVSAERLLRLAETMSSRQSSLQGWTFESLLLHLDILQGRGKHEEALQLVVDTTPTTSSAVIPMFQKDRLQLQGSIAARAGDLDAAASFYRQADVDDWKSFQYHLDCIMPGSALEGESPITCGAVRFPVGICGGLAEAWDRRNGRKTENSKDYSSVYSTINIESRLLENSAEIGNRTRTVTISRLELSLRKYRMQAISEDQFVDEIATAYDNLKTSFSCAADMQRGLQALDSIDGKKKLVAHFQANSSSFPSSSVVTELQKYQAVVNAKVVEAEIGLPIFASPEEAETYAAELIHTYKENVHLSDSLNEKERGFGEELLTLAVSALVKAHRLEGGGRLKRLLQALHCLEVAQVRRKASAPLRLAAASLCSVLSASVSLKNHLDALDIKNILHDSMTGHWLLPAALDDSVLASGLEGLGRLHEEQPVEASDQLMNAFKHGTYSKIFEFVDFWSRLEFSAARASARIDAQLLKLRGCIVNKDTTRLPELVDVAVTRLQASPQLNEEKIRFNDDLSTRPAWFPPLQPGGRLGIADWWLTSTSLQDEEVPCWWNAVGAAEKDGAKKWRQAQLAYLKRKWAIPFVLKSALPGDNPYTYSETVGTGNRWEDILQKCTGALTTRNSDQFEIDGAMVDACAVSVALAMEVAEMLLWASVCCCFWSDREGRERVHQWSPKLKELIKSVSASVELYDQDQDEKIPPLWPSEHVDIDILTRTVYSERLEARDRVLDILEAAHRLLPQ